MAKELRRGLIVCDFDRVFCEGERAVAALRLPSPSLFSESVCCGLMGLWACGPAGLKCMLVCFIRMYFVHGGGFIACLREQGGSVFDGARGR